MALQKFVRKVADMGLTEIMKKCYHQKTTLALGNYEDKKAMRTSLANEPCCTRLQLL